MVKLVINASKQKMNGGGCPGFDGSNHVVVDGYDVDLGLYGGNMRCSMEGCFF